MGAILSLQLVCLESFKERINNIVQNNCAIISSVYRGCFKDNSYPFSFFSSKNFISPRAIGFSPRLVNCIGFVSSILFAVQSFHLIYDYSVAQPDYFRYLPWKWRSREYRCNWKVICRTFSSRRSLWRTNESRIYIYTPPILTKSSLRWIGRGAFVLITFHENDSLRRP